MVTKAQQRIEKAKRKYKVAEDATDSLLLRLAASRWTVAIIVVAALCVIGAWVQWG